jgi:ATP-binding cassette subfamily C protein CydCD
VSRGPIDPRLLRHARSSRGGVAGLGLLGLGQAAATVLVAVALSRLLAGSSAAAVAVLAAAYVARAGLSWGEQVVAQRTAARVTDELRRSVLAAALRRGPAWVARYGSGRLIAVLTGGLDALGPWFSGYLPSLVLAVALPPLVIVAMAVVDAASALVAVLTLPLIPVLGALIGWATQARARQRWEADAGLAGHFLDVVQGLATLRLFGRAERQVEVVAAMTDRHRAATMRVLRVAFLSSTALDLVGTLSVGLIAVEAGLRVAAGGFGLGPALLVILLAPEAYRPLREVAARFHASADAAAVVGDVDEVLAGAPPAAGDPARTGVIPDARHASPADRAHVGTVGAVPPVPAGDHALARDLVSGPPTRAGYQARARDILSGPPVPAGDHARARDILSGPPAPAGDQARARDALSGPPVPAGDLAAAGGGAGAGAVGVAAHGLRARYPGSDEDALRLDRLRVSGGQFVALCGPSGAGKTTLLRVLAGLQPVEAGAVEVSGPPPRYLPQRPMVPHARTVTDVFRSDDGATPARHEIVAALRAVGLDGQVAPDTPLGERGQGVSAGQRQRLALAALLRRARFGPAVLLLDEPTAHLDTATEQLVIAELRAAARRGYAVLAVAHRPALREAADAVVEIEPPHPRHPSAAVMDIKAPDPGHSSAAVMDIQAPHPRHPSGAVMDIEAPHPGHRSAAGFARVDGRSQPTREEALSHKSDERAELGRWVSVLRRPAVAVALGAASWLAGIVLTGAAAWLLVRASARPPVLTLSAAVVLVRAAAVARPLLRYLERLVAHEVAFARLGARRARVYASLIPRVPGPRLHRRGDLLTRVADDVDAQVDGLLRGRLPAIAAAVAVVPASIAAALVAPAAGIPLAAGLAIAAVVAPAVAARRATRREAATAVARAQLRDAVVETIDGVEDLAPSRVPPVQAAITPATSTRTADSPAQRAATPRNWARTADSPAQRAATPRNWARTADSPAPGIRKEAPATVFGGAGVAVPLDRSGVLAALEARAARAAGLAAALGHLGWGLAVAGAATALSHVDGLAPEWAAVLLLGIVALGEPVASLPDAAVARRRAAAADRRIAELAAEPTGTHDPSSAATGPVTAALDAAAGGAKPSNAAFAVAAGAPVPVNAAVDVVSPPTPDDAASSWGDVAVRGLVAGWDPERAPALRGVDLDLPAGSRVAVLGASGSGKSTLAAVLARLLDQRAGTVTVGGTDLRRLPDALIRRRIGLVGDDADHVFASTVRENLRLARPDAGDVELARALRRVGLGDWPLSRRLGSGGTTMSGGQRKRFATARALLADPALLILDEPTEGLDEPAAEALMADLLDASAGRTVLLLTHRTEGLDRVDRILEIAAGRTRTLTRAEA